MERKRNPKATRQAILDAAFQEVHLKGFQAAGINDIIARTGVTKGAFYHHFPTKAALGYALIDETLMVYLNNWWTDPIQDKDDPIDAILTVMRTRIDHDIPPLVKQGCPINNLAQEMPPLDDGFRQRLEGLYRTWRKATALALSRGQHTGTVRTDAETTQAASVIIAFIQGGFSQAKAAQSMEPFADCLSGLADYTQTLRP